MKSVNIGGDARSSKWSTFNYELIMLSIGSLQYALPFAFLSEDRCSFYVKALEYCKNANRNSAGSGIRTPKPKTGSPIRHDSF
jgi:hypothetical protein